MSHTYHVPVILRLFISSTWLVSLCVCVVAQLPHIERHGISEGSEVLVQSQRMTAGMADHSFYPETFRCTLWSVCLAQTSQGRYSGMDVAMQHLPQHRHAHPQDHTALLGNVNDRLSCLGFVEIM